MDPMTWDVIKTLFSCVLSFALGLVAAALTRRRTREDKHVEEMQQKNNELLSKQAAIEQGVLAIVRKTLIDQYDLFVRHDAPMTVERRDEIEKQYHAYKVLGGNGVIDDLYEEMMDQPTIIVNKQEVPVDEQV